MEGMVTTLAKVFKMVDRTQLRWQRLRGHQLIPKVFEGVNFIGGVEKSTCCLEFSEYSKMVVRFDPFDKFHALYIQANRQVMMFNVLTLSVFGNSHTPVVSRYHTLCCTNILPENNLD